MHLFSTSFEAAIFSSTILLWVFLEIIGTGILPKLQRRGGAIKRTNNSSTQILRVLSYASVLIAIFFALKNIAMLPEWFFYLGIFLMVMGILVRLWAILTLGRFFNITISVQKDQKVVDHGPYRYIRHPSYLGLSLIFIGIGVALMSLAGILVILAGYGLAIGYRIHFEEKFLISELGDDYIQYMKRTKRLIPFVF